MKGDRMPGRTGRLSLASLLRYVEKRLPSGAYRTDAISADG
jgi:hypothetical protein